MPPSTPTPTSKIDVHAHFVPDFYRAALDATGHTHPDGMPAIPAWTPTAHLALMDAQHITTAYLSISSPGTHLVAHDDAAARALTRRCNAYGARLRAAHPGRFGHLASLPLPDVAGAVAEVEKAVAEGCDGFVVLSNAHGRYVGEAGMEAVMGRLDGLGAVVLVHPTSPVGCGGGGGGVGGAGEEGRWPNPMLEFFFDTARVVTSLFLGGDMRRYPNIRFILPHLGGAFPPLLSRWTGFSGLVPGPWTGVSEEEVKRVFEERVWFDMAGFVFPGQIRGLIDGVGVGSGRLLYGSDYPFTNEKGVGMLMGQMDEGMKGMFTEDEVEGVCWRNAEGLFGR
jgi:predicted TIM-barrel fold metal-dependent hydrolase